MHLVFSLSSLKKVEPTKKPTSSEVILPPAVAFMEVLDILILIFSTKKKNPKKKGGTTLLEKRNLIINYKPLIHYNLFFLLASQVCDLKDAYCQDGGGWGGKGSLVQEKSLVL